jgi:methanogenic corrinoid protein MtbC1
MNREQDIPFHFLYEHSLHSRPGENQMPPINRTPAYNLKAVLTETGLTADVLRAWERRYGLPLPQRTSGGQRLYSQYDIALIKWLKARQAEGLSISRAIDLWKETVNAGHDPLANYPGIGSRSFAPRLAPSEDQVEILRRRWLETCYSFDEAAADQILNQAFSLYSIETVCTDLLQHGIKIIGDWWYHGEASVQNEHFASAIAARRVETLIASTPSPTRPQTVLVGCPPGELHAFPALLLTLFLRRRGFNLVYLSTDVPAEHLTDTNSIVHPDLVALAAQRLPTAASLRQVTAQLKASGIQSGYGGYIFNRTPRLRERIPAHFLGETIKTAVENIELLCNHPLQVPEVAPISVSLAAVTHAYRQQRAQIESEVFASLQAQSISTENISATNEYLGTELTAALELGDPSALSADIEWAKMLLAQRNISPEQLPVYLASYQQAIRKALGTESNVMNDFINALY